MSESSTKQIAYSKEDWIKHAAILKVQSCEMAAALMECKEPITKIEVKKLVEAYRKKKGV